jgi:WD40 repeat protein
MLPQAHALEERLATAGLLPRDARDACKSPTGARNGARRAGSGTSSPLPAAGGSGSGTSSSLSGSGPRPQASWPGPARAVVSIDAPPAPVHAFKMQQSFKVRASGQALFTCAGPGGLVLKHAHQRNRCSLHVRASDGIGAQGHLMSVAALALHPSKPILVTASDDKSWNMWALPGGELIMCGEGHRDWVAGVDFHPSGTSLASGSGDATVKV